MIKHVLTCPFTGGEYHAIENDSTHTLMVLHPTQKVIHHYKYDANSDCYLLPRDIIMSHDDLINTTEASHILNVTRQRMTQIIKNDVIPHTTIAGHVMFSREDVLSYAQNRKVGAPPKEGKNGRASVD